LILANSIRSRRRCIAGKEIIKENDKYKIGNWIRPVSDCGEGEIDSAKIRL